MYLGWTVPLALLVVLAVLTSGSLFAQIDLSDEVQNLEDLRNEQNDVQDESEGSGEHIDLATASLDEVSAMLDQLAANVRVEKAKLADAEREVESAHRAAEEAATHKANLEVEQIAVRKRITELAVAGFTGDEAISEDGLAELLLSDNPGEVERFRHLVQHQTGTLSDGLDRMRSLELEQELAEIELAAATKEAEAALADVVARIAAVEQAEAEQLRVVQAAETRLEARLAEAAFLEERDIELAQDIRDQQIDINNQVARVAARNGIKLPPPVDIDDIVALTFEEFGTDFQIEVHVEIAAATKAMFDQAYSEGVTLGGWGYRPIQRQIELRAAHCGGSEQDIWHRPVFECSPPTARPGFSKHEHGRAVDLTYNGASIVSHSSPGFIWLAANAPRYGFVNLESEPWHWSIADGSGQVAGRTLGAS